MVAAAPGLTYSRNVATAHVPKRIHLNSAAMLGIAAAGGAKTAWFKDTEGNILAIVQDVRR
jgi:hypothetical protein